MLLLIELIGSFIEFTIMGVSGMATTFTLLRGPIILICCGLVTVSAYKRSQNENKTEREGWEGGGESGGDGNIEQERKETE